MYVPHLRFQEGDKSLFDHLIRSNTRTMIGRSDRCDVALPSETVSRVHCVIERRMEGWWLSDRSRHGTTVNGQAIERHLLAHGDVIGMGAYSAEFSLHDARRPEVPTATRPMPAAVHEDLVEVDDGGYAACRALLRFTAGPLAETTLLVGQARASLGGPGSHFVLDEDLPPAAMWIRVVRSRAMFEPGSGAVFLAGTRVREITPGLPGEEVRIGAHAFIVETETVEERGRTQEGFCDMVGVSESMRRIFAVLTRMAVHDHPVLLTGESGTGKELAARGLHMAGPRYEEPFVPINCAAVADSLFESELFGHVKGAFTGADRDQNGAFQNAAGGTLFLDEVGELKLDLQAKLLRALESGEVRKVGAPKAEFPDVRVVAATNRSLPDMVRAGTFRSDLYFRLSVLTLRLPPLRERKEDIPLIARALLRRNHPTAVITDEALRALGTYDWPGNVRELRNVLTRAFVMAGSVIGAGDLAFNPWAFDDEPERVEKLQQRRVEDDAERVRILKVLREHEGNRTKTARDLGIPRSSLLYKMRKLGINVSRI